VVNENQDPVNKWQLGGWSFDVVAGLLLREGREVALSPTELEMLKLLVERFPDSVTVEELRDRSGCAKSGDEAHRVAAHISNLRKALLPGRMIAPKTSKGYRLMSREKAPSAIDSGPGVGHEPGRKYEWNEVREAARSVGEEVFGKFRANVIVSYPGPSAIFANLVLVEGLPERKALLGKPVYLVQQRDWTETSRSRKAETLAGHRTLIGENVAILVPSALLNLIRTKRRQLRVAVIDDVILSGNLPALLRPYLVKKLGKRERVMFACFAYFKDTTDVIGREEPFSIEKVTSANFELPWGMPFWFRGDAAPPARRNTHPRSDTEAI